MSGPRLANQPRVEVADTEFARIMAAAAVGAGSNNAVTINSGGAISPASTINWDSNSFTSKISGRILVVAFMYVQLSAIDNAATFNLIRDRTGANVTIGAGGSQDGGHVNKDASMTLVWIDSVTVGTAHTYTIQCTASAGTVTVPAANETVVVLVELP